MTKADIVNEIAKSTGVEKVQVQAIVEAFMENVKGAMIEGKNVYLSQQRKKGKDQNIQKQTTSEHFSWRFLP